MFEVDLFSRTPDRFQEVLDPGRYEEFLQGVDRGAQRLRGRTVWNINSTAAGGGVSEMLHSLLPYVRGAGIETRWLVIEGNPEFFGLTKRLHNLLHGVKGKTLGEGDRRIYQQALAPSVDEVAALIDGRDIVIVHDPQPAGLVPALKGLGATVIWRCHIGIDVPTAPVRMAWEFLMQAVREADAWVFSREAYAWDGLDRDRVAVIPPSIDAFSPKNQDMQSGTVAAILRTAGIQDGPASDPGFVRQDGSPGRVSRAASLTPNEPLPASARLVTQVSRWDRLKDPAGVLTGFAEHVLGDADAHLVLAGPGQSSVSDDPEDSEVLKELTETWEGLSGEARKRIHIACLPTEDPEENAAIVNALQRRSEVIVQKSLAEGFGLTVTEGMWKERPVVASRVGGIQDQVVNDETGLLIDDPRDLAAFGRAVSEILRDGERAAAMGRAGRERVRKRFLGPPHLLSWLDLFERLGV
jgi:trehalose synthase